MGRNCFTNRESLISVPMNYNLSILYVIIISRPRKNSDSQRYDDVISCTAGNW